MSDPLRWSEDPALAPELAALLAELRPEAIRTPLPAELRSATKERLQKSKRRHRPSRGTVALVGVIAAAAALALWVASSRRGPAPSALHEPIAPDVEAQQPERLGGPPSAPRESMRSSEPHSPRRRVRASSTPPRLSALPLDDEDDPISFRVAGLDPPAGVRSRLLGCYAPRMGRQDAEVTAELDGGGRLRVRIAGVSAPLAACLRRQLLRSALQIDPTQTALTFHLAFGVAARGAPIGWLSLRTDPPAHVFIDGRYSGLQTPFGKRSFPAGEHDLELVTDDGRSFALHVRIPVGTTVRLERALED